MTQFFTVLTAIGEAKIANATALGTKVNIAELAVGDGNGSIPTPVRTQTALVNEVRRAPLNSIDIDESNANYIICEQVIPESIGGFTIREIGIYDDEGYLLAVGNFPETYKPILEEGSGRTQVIRCVLMVTSTDAVDLKIDPSIVLATREYVEQHFLAKSALSNSIISDNEEDVASSLAAKKAAHSLGSITATNEMACSPNTISESISTPENTNAMLIGPEITLPAGVDITVPASSCLTII